MSNSQGALARLRRPEYTGANRCLPCTVVNVALAGVLSVALGAAAASVGTTTLGVAVGAATFALGAAAIAIRGYLVPGTPELTKRYLPSRVLAAFGKDAEPAMGADGGLTTPAEQPDVDDVDPEAVLMEVDALEPCADRQDLCLADDFAADWHDAIDRVKASDDYDALFHVLEVDEGDVEVFQRTKEMNVRVEVNGEYVGVWPSQAALLADLGGAVVLADRYDGWDDLTGFRRSELLSSLRLFVDECPSCGAAPEFAEETMESCCDRKEVVVITCTECDSRLLEMPAP